MYQVFIFCKYCVLRIVVFAECTKRKRNDIPKSAKSIFYHFFSFESKKCVEFRPIFEMIEKTVFFSAFSSIWRAVYFVREKKMDFFLLFFFAHFALIAHETRTTCGALASRTR